MLDARVGAILEAVSSLDATLAAEASACDDLLAEREKLIQEQWRLNKELAALKRMGEDYDALADVHSMLSARQSEVQAGLQRLLADVKALAGELRRV